MARDFFAEFRSGREDAYLKVYHRFSSYTFAYFFVRAGHLQDAEDLSQTLWMSVFESRSDFAGASFRELFGWLKELARQIYIGRRPACETAMGLEEVIDPTPFPEEELLAREAAEQMVLAMSGLSQTDRDLLVFVFYQDLSHIEIAELLAIPKEHVTARVFQALVRYKRVLQEMDHTLYEGIGPMQAGQLLTWAMPAARVPA